MNIIKIMNTLLLSLCLLSAAVQGKTSMFGLDLGTSTLSDIKQRYTLTGQNSADGMPETWHYYSLSGKQLSDSTAKDATLYFDGNQVLGKVILLYPSSEPTFNELDKIIYPQYPRVVTPPFTPDEFQLRQNDYQNDDTHVRIMYSHYGTDITFTDLIYQAAAQDIIAKRNANKTKLSTNDNKGANR